MLKVWDGKSKTRQGNKYAAPDAADWGRATQEIKSTQIEVNKIEKGDLYYNEADDFIIIGQLITLNEDHRIVRASKFRPEVLGISIVDANPNENIIYITQGKLTLIEWDEELIPGATYYLLMSEAGGLTAVPPSAVGEAVVVIGRAQNWETLDINIRAPIYL